MSVSVCCVCAHIHVTWLSVWAPLGTSLLSCPWSGGCHVSLEERPGLCVSASMFASLCITVYLGLYACEREGESLHIWVDTAF